MFRETLKSDPTLASVPDSAISLARANKGETDTACVLANGYADDAEQARHNPPPKAGASATAAPSASEFVAGTPRVHFEITPPPPPQSTAKPGATATPRGGPASEMSRPAATAETAAPVETPAAPASDERPAAALAACLKACESVWNPQAKVACEQRCNGATPLPGATSEPVIVH